MENKSMSTKKKLAILAGIIATIFIGVNLTWFIGVWMPYNKYTENMTPLNDGTRYYMYTDDKYDYYVKMPFYLEFNKNFFRVEDAGGTVIYLDDEGNQSLAKDKYITLFIWPDFGGKEYSYGVLYEGIFNGNETFSQFYIDNELNILTYDEENPDNNKKYQKMVVENNEQISEMLHRARGLWTDLV